MAQNVYSVRLWSMNTASGGPTFTGPQVPAGFVWVVRDVRMVVANVPANNIAAAITLSSGGTLYIASSPAYGSVPGILYEWHGRAIVNTGENLVAHTSSPNWDMTVDGYQLSLP